MGLTKKTYDFLNEVIGHWYCDVNPYSSTIVTLHKDENSVYDGRHFTIFFMIPFVYSYVNIKNGYGNIEYTVNFGPIRTTRLIMRLFKAYGSKKKQEKEKKFEEIFKI